MRKKWILVAVLFVFFMPVACGKGKEFKPVEDGLRYSETYQISSIAEEGVFYKGQDELVRFRPVGEEKDMVLCYNPNCMHLPASHDNPDPECRAALYDSRTNIAYYEGNIYFFVADGVFKHKIYRMAVDGSGRKLMAEIPYYHNALQGVTFYEDRMYYTVYENVVDKESDDIKSLPYLLEYRLDEGTYRLITKESGDAFMTIQATENYVFLRMISNSSESGGDVYLKRVNVNTLEEEIIITPADYKKNSFVRAYDDDNYIYYEFYDTVGIRNISKGKDRVLIDETGNGEIGLLTASGNGIFYCLCDVDEEGNVQITGYYFYDIITGETMDISDKGFEYGLTSYDGFNKVFIAGALHDTMTISEEEILGSDH